MAYDMASYLCPANGHRFRLFGLGDEACQSVQATDGWREFRKNRHIEEFYVTAAVVGRGADTSELSKDGVHPDGQFYVQYRREGSTLAYGAPWCKRFMEERETFRRAPYVVRYSAQGGQIASYDDISILTVLRHYPTLTFAKSGLNVADVLELQWGGEETYFYANGFGLVGWTNQRTGASSYVGALDAIIQEPFPHAIPRPPAPQGETTMPIVTAPPPTADPLTATPSKMTFDLWLHKTPDVETTSRIRQMAPAEAVSVYPATVLHNGDYDWVYVKDALGNTGYAAVSVAGKASFDPAILLPADPAPAPAPPPAPEPTIAVPVSVYNRLYAAWVVMQDAMKELPPASDGSF